MTERAFLHLGSIRDVADFRHYLHKQQIILPCDQKLMAGSASPLAVPLRR